MSLEHDADLLSRLPLFSDLAPDQLRLLAFSAARHELNAGQRLFRYGDPARSGYVVVSGMIVLSAGDGGEASVSETCGPGYLIGELTLFVESKRRATATATLASGALEITRHTMVRLLREYPAIGVSVHKRLAERLTETMDDLERVRHTLMAIAE